MVVFGALEKTDTYSPIPRKCPTTQLQPEHRQTKGQDGVRPSSYMVPEVDGKASCN